MVKTVSIIAGLAACGGGSSHHLNDSNGGGSGSDAGVVYPCSLQVASSDVSGDTNATGGSCTPSSQGLYEFGLNFLAPAANGDSAMCEMACTLPDGTIPQTLGVRTGTMGCNVEIDWNKVGNGLFDSWASDASSTIDVTVTNLTPISGTISMTLVADNNNSGVTLTVNGTF